MSFLKEYTLLGELGKGGFAKVYKVRHNELGYIRAIRVLSEPITDENSRTYQKFLHECKVLLRLGNGSHRNIVHIYQPRLLDNHALVEMDYVDGQDIAHYLKDNGNFLPIGEVLRMVEEMSDALAYCHEDIYQFCMDPDEDDLRNDPVDGSKFLIDEATRTRLVEKYKVIHNDIHSGNIMRRRDGSFVLLDFGLAIEGDEVVKSSSRHENGSPEYMPPEKWDNETILTEQSDVYSFGVVMYEYLAGRVPYVCEGNSFNARTRLYEKIKNSTGLPSIADLRKSFFEEKHKGETYKKDYPDWLETAILRCLEKDPANRFRNGKELHEFIMRHLQGEAITKEALQSLSEELVSVKNERQQALAQIAVLTKKNNELAQESQGIEELQQQIVYLQKHGEDLERQVWQTQQEKTKLREEVEKAKLGSGSRKKIWPLIILCVLMGLAALAMGALYADAKKEPAPVYAGDDEVKEENAVLKDENDNLKQQVESLTERASKLEQSNEALTDQVTALTSAQNTDGENLSEASARIMELEGQIANLNREIANHNKEIADLESAKTTLTTKATNLENQLSQAQNANSELTKKNKAQKAEIDRLDTENKSLKKSSSNDNELQTQLDQANKTIKTLKSERNNLEKEVHSLEAEREKLKKEIKVLQDNCL